MSLNKVILIGNLGRDPEVRYMPNGEAVCNFSIATSETWNDRQSGQRQERTEWHNITMYRRLAEIAGQYLKKGSQVYIEGRIQSRKYTGKDGIERSRTTAASHRPHRAARPRPRLPRRWKTSTTTFPSDAAFRTFRQPESTQAGIRNRKPPCLARNFTIIPTCRRRTASRRSRPATTVSAAAAS